MIIPTYLVPITLASVSFITTFATFYVILIPKFGVLSKLAPGMFAHLDELELHPLELEITPLLEDKISDFLEETASQIPMGPMILAGTLGQSIKSKALKAVLEMLPKLKSKGLEKGEQLLMEGLQKHWKMVLWKYGAALALFSGVLGALCGLIIIQVFI